LLAIGTADAIKYVRNQAAIQLMMSVWEKRTQRRLANGSASLV
jgi:hypothetical protein